MACLASASLAGAEPAETAAGAAVAPVRERASIVLIAEVGADRELSLLLRELLSRRGVDAEITRVDRFDPDALFASGGQDPLRIFVATQGSREARLYFRAPGGERYLVRRLTLPSGLDAVGRELVGQVVESSTGALLDSSQGVSREQASRQIAADAPAVAPSPPPAAAPSSPSPSRKNGGPASFEPRFTARYSTAWLGADLGLYHAPGIGVGIRRVGRVLVGIELAGERGFEQTLSTAELEVRVQASNLSLVAELGFVLGQQAHLLLGAGPRLELSRVHVVARSHDVTPAGDETHTGAGLRLVLGHEWTFEHLALGAAVFGDVSFERTHYDLLFDDPGTRRLARVPSWHPGVSVSIALH